MTKGDRNKTGAMVPAQPAPYAAYSLGVGVVKGKDACALKGRKRFLFRL